MNAGLLNRGNTLEGEADCTDIKIRGRYIILQTDCVLLKENIINSIYNAGSQRRVCDYVIISDEVVLVCELKSNNVGHMSSQLKNTGRLVKYLLEMIKEYNDIRVNIPPVKYVCFARKYSGIKQKAIADKLNGIQWYNSELFQLSCSSIYHLNQFN